MFIASTYFLHTYNKRYPCFCQLTYRYYLGSNNI